VTAVSTPRNVVHRVYRLRVRSPAINPAMPYRVRLTKISWAAASCGGWLHSSSQGNSRGWSFARHGSEEACTQMRWGTWCLSLIATSRTPT